MSGLPELHDEARRFEGYLQSSGSSRVLARWEPLSGGRSATSVKVTFVERAEEKSAVLHLASPQGPLAGVANVRRQYELLEALADTPLPSPRPMGFLEAEWLGREGYLSEFVPGAVPDPWRASGRAFIDPRSETIKHELMRRLAEIHAVPVERLPKSAVARAQGEHFGSHERRRWSRAVELSPIFAHDPLLAYADAWLGTNLPPRNEERLIHGDYRIGNLVFDDGGRILSVLDWELAEIGDPLYDIGTLCSPALEMGGRVAGVSTQAALVDAYERASGRAVDAESLAFYRVLGTFKIVCLWVNASLPGLPAATDLSAVRAHFSVLEARPFLAKALGIAVNETVAASDGLLMSISRELRRVGDGLPQKDASDTVRNCAAILTEYSRLTPLSAADAEAIRQFALDVGEGSTWSESGEPLRALAAIIRSVMHDQSVAGDRDNPVHLRLRQLLARTGYAAPSIGGGAASPGRTKAGRGV